MAKFTDMDLEGAAWAKALEGHNDPFYYQDLEEKARVLDEISASTLEVILFRNQGDRRHPNRVEVSLARPKHTAEATKVACGIGEALAIPVRVVEKPQPAQSPDIPQKFVRTDAPHKFFKNDVTFSKRR